jgi:hypothetical protein
MLSFESARFFKTYIPVLRVQRATGVRKSARIKETAMSQEIRISRVWKTGRLQESRRKRQKNNSYNNALFPPT